MKKKFLLYLFCFAAVCFFGPGCAKINAPTGGPRDKEAPVVVRSTPGNGARNFNGKEVMISFNEYVVLDKISEKFMVSPPMKKRPDIYIRGKNIHIKYDDPLRENTTYTFYFQDAIKDLNEGNAINNYQFVFSTGPYIDSLSVTGNIYTGLNLDPPENTLVLLYSNPEDTCVKKQLPDYLSRSTEKGEFRIDNVHPGKYRLYGLADADNSKNYNNRDEAFAFLNDTILVTPEKNFIPVKQVKKDSVAVKPVNGKAPFVPPVIGEYPLVMFEAEKKAHYLTSSARKQAYQLTFTLSLPPDSAGFRFSLPESAERGYYIEKNKTSDSITVWLTDTTLYNKTILEPIVSYPFTDTLGITALRDDTIRMRFDSQKPSKSRAPKRVAYKVSTNITGQERPDKKFVLTAPAPFKEPDTSKIGFYEVAKENKIHHQYKLIKDKSNSCRYFLETELGMGKSYLVVTDSAAFSSIYGDVSDSTGYRFTVMTADLFGKLTLDISGVEGNTIIQLLDNTEKLIRQTIIKSNGKTEFPLLEKGLYRVKAIYDLNNDGKWTTGDFDTHLQPEPVSYYPVELEIKENWQIVQPWTLTGKNMKEPKLQKIKPASR